MPTRHGPTPSVPVVSHALSRRSFLQIGALGLGGLSLSGLLRAEALSGVGAKWLITRSFDRWFAIGYGCLVAWCLLIWRLANTDAWDRLATLLL
jgi:hypothetical protein